RENIQQALYPFCERLYDESLEWDDVDFLSTNAPTCFGFLYNMHSQPDKTIIEDWIKNENEAQELYSDEDLEVVIEIVNEHYDIFSRRAPASLDARLMYNPSSWNPVRTLTSVLSHADWLHVLGNLIFFFAFAAAIETLLISKLHYIGFMLMTAIIIDITYSLSILASGSPPLPSLGLSGVVSGVIGLSAFLMPRARIRTFIWFIVFYLKAFPMPAWILALWFIGWDAYYLMAYSDHGGINLIAHVTGGVTGYLYGFFFLKKHRKSIQEELDEEINYMRNTRSDQPGATSSHRSGDKYSEHIQERDAKREHANYSQKLYRYVNVGNNSEAIVLYLKDYDLYEGSIEIYEDLYEEMDKWKKCRALLCLGRLIINLLIEQKENKRALNYIIRCLKIKEDFVLATPQEAITMTLYAMELQQYPLAYQIIRRADLRYGKYIDLDHAQYLEAQILLLHLESRDEAKKTLKRLADRKPISYRKEIASLIEVYKHG
ncbi:MAG: rhomboid family intramembrane serine protease, partial [Gammaproteobacteria bacterium]|nr:rhomboid family intramembrane serine protease [Gammaproteobacteria bacterium]